ncbi:amiloride-sensitive sodium channel subunit alpha-like isoform X1 [Lytechinus variegatus]|uniref:amiloride-sensitive sodium channel subunit alpha-like isoform X1 n=1 Tax=Lytechinus variegatus TaxID=7654 RepID=UPI001BB23B5F|nr:amiloride-sensitive sodium channel subunit alpha-like isoform X1 [Lytechinus variegatus]
MGKTGEEKCKEDDNETITRAAHEFGDETTLHGLRYLIVRGHLLFRLCWLAILILAFALLVIQAKIVYEDFQSSPYSTKMDIVPEMTKTFPAVTVCNDNKIRRSRLYNTKYQGLIDIDDGEVSVNETGSTTDRESDNVWASVTGDYDWQGFYSASMADDFSDFINVVSPSRAELSDYGHTLEDFVIQCTYNQRTCNLSTDFTVLQNRHYGNCFTFNFGREENSTLKMTTKTGALSGLHLSLMVEEDEYMGLLAPIRGAKIVIHAPHITPFPEDDGISLETGSAFSIGIREEVIQRLPKFSDCIDEDTDFINSSYSGFYSVRCCFKACYQQSLFNECGCVDDILLDYRQCRVTSKREMLCKSEVESRYINDELQCECPLPCKEKNYRTSISSASWPSKRFKPHLLSKFHSNPKIRMILEEEEKARSNLIRVMIYFETLNVERVEQVPRYTIPNILGNVGGLMGLFTGMSFISLFEVAFLLLRITKITFTKLFPSSQVHSVKA